MRRLAVLTTFEGDWPFTNRHPHDGEKVAAALGPLRPGWRFDTWPVSQGQWPDEPLGYDGIVITGSPASVNDQSAWIRRLEELVRELHARKHPMLGICFGHQVIAKALGGQVGASPAGLRVGTITSRLNQHAPWMQPPQRLMTLYAAQEDHVVGVPSGASCFGGDEVCPVTFYAIGNHIFSTQCHPEFYPAFMEDLLRAVPEHMTAEAHARGCAQVREPVDSDLARQWIVQFFDQAFAPRA
jgi:GMP synthase-like glutamine amidotransferase